MMDRLVTVATFDTPVAANLACNRLEAAGLKAFLADEEQVSMAWHLTNALGGIKLQVQAEDADEALALLAELPAVPAPERDDVGTEREQNAGRAFRGAVLGLVFWPVQLYVFWLLLKVFASNESLSQTPRRQAYWAAAINLPFMLLFCLWLRMMLAG